MSSRNLPDLYSVVDVGQDASEAEIRRAFRRAAWRWHPDLIAGRIAAAAAAQAAAMAAAAAADAAQIGIDLRVDAATAEGGAVEVWEAVAEAEARFKELTAAYTVLRDPRRRAAYDRKRAAADDEGGDAEDIVDAIVIEEIVDDPAVTRGGVGDGTEADPDDAAARTAELLRSLIAKRRRDTTSATARSSTSPAGGAGSAPASAPASGGGAAERPEPAAAPSAAAPTEAQAPTREPVGVPLGDGPVPGTGRIVRKRKPADAPPDHLGYAIAETPLGLAMVVCADGAVCAVNFADEGALDAYERSLPRLFGAPAMAHDADAQAVFGQITQYLAGRRRRFDVDIRLIGVPAFRAELLQAMRKLPYGRTASLADVGRLVDRPVATRAVTEACSQNPVPLLIPTHRVVMPNGRIAADPAHRTRTESLLDLERRVLAALRRARSAPS